MNRFQSAVWTLAILAAPCAWIAGPAAAPCQEEAGTRRASCPASVTAWGTMLPKTASTTVKAATTDDKIDRLRDETFGLFVGVFKRLRAIPRRPWIWVSFKDFFSAKRPLSNWTFAILHFSQTMEVLTPVRNKV